MEIHRRVTTLLKNTIFFLSLLLLTSISLNTLSAAGNTGIVIDNETRQLIAPEGISYHWFRNGTPIKARSQKIRITESGTYRVEVITEDGNKTIEIIGVVVKSDGIRRIFIIGDSTVQTYGESDYPMMGWGQVLQLFFDEGQIQVINKAIGGRSSRKFYQEGRWDEVADLLDSNDYVFIQFGHNDRDWTKEDRYTDTADYKVYLRIYVNESREKGAIPVLVSPMIMNAWTLSDWRGTLRNVFTEGANNYRGAMLQVAEELDAPFIDLNMKSWNLVNGLGGEYAAMFLHMGLEPGEYPNYPGGSTDVGTHYQEMGALEMARLVVEGIDELEEDPAMAILVEARTPTTTVSTEISSPDAGLVSAGGTYPIGSHITLKTRLKSPRTLDHWEDALGNVVSGMNLFMFTLEDSLYYYKAMVTDCNGEMGGEAKLDACLLCSGGSSGYLPCELTFESEDACSYTGKKTSKTIGDDKRTVVNTLNVTDSIGLAYSIETSAAGTYDFAFIYHSVITGEQLSIFVNGEEVISGLELVQAEEWSHVRFQLDLEQGQNTVLLKSSALEGGIIFDMLVAYSADLAEGECETATLSPENKSTNCTAYPNPFTEEITLQAKGRVEYRIYNTLGIEVVKGIAGNNHRVGSVLPRGTYLLQITNDLETSVQLIRKY